MVLSNLSANFSRCVIRTLCQVFLLIYQYLSFYIYPITGRMNALYYLADFLFQGF
jgi:hypothetical protein